MSDLTNAFMGARSHQMFPILDRLEIERVRRFGVVRAYSAGDPLVKVGDAGHGLAIILVGDVDVTRHHESGSRELIVTHHPGAFMGELAQLAGRLFRGRPCTRDGRSFAHSTGPASGVADSRS